jgi:hypothetical protein
MSQFEKFFDVLEYPDVVLGRWVAKPARERLDVIKRHFDEFRTKMQAISATIAATPQADV